MSKHLPVTILSTLVGAGLVVASLAAPANADPIRCEIHVKERGNAIALEAVVLASKAAEGTYELHVTGSGTGGSSDIAQSGDFTVAAGAESSVGSVTLSNDGTSYVARLAVTSDSGTHRCTKNVGSL